MAMKLKSLFSTTGLSLLSFTVFAQHQSPDQSIGKKSKILSLSNGKYDKSFYKDSRTCGYSINQSLYKKDRKPLAGDAP